MATNFSSFLILGGLGQLGVGLAKLLRYGVSPTSLFQTFTSFRWQLSFNLQSSAYKSFTRTQFSILSICPFCDWGKFAIKPNHTVYMDRNLRNQIVRQICLLISSHRTQYVHISPTGDGLEKTTWFCPTSGNPPTTSSIMVYICTVCVKVHVNHPGSRLSLRFKYKHANVCAFLPQVHSSSLTSLTTRTSRRLWLTATSAGWSSTLQCCLL